MKVNQLISTYPLSFPAPEKPYDGPTFDRSGHQIDFVELRDSKRNAERRSRPRPSSSPDSNTGGKLTSPKTSHEVSLDWIRMSGPVGMRHEAVRLLAHYYGNPTYGTGRYFLNAGYRFGAAAVYFEQDDEQGKDHCVVDLPGSAMAEISMADAVTLLADLLGMGFRSTRLDIAVDLYCEPTLIESVTKSCMNGELCRAKKFRPQHVQSGQEITGYGCNIGDRGKLGSGRYLRVYDKGLETKERERGQWVRWEAELANEPANEASKALALNDDAVAVGIAHAFGVCDFRENSGAKHLDRRPRCKWYQDLLQNVEPQRVVQSRTKSTVHSFKRWMQSAVLPKMETLAAASGNRMDQLLQILFDECNPDPEHLEDPKVRALCIETGTDPSDAMRRLNNRRLVMIAVEDGAA
jgi:Replication initiation factor